MTYLHKNDTWKTAFFRGVGRAFIPSVGHFLRGRFRPDLDWVCSGSLPVRFPETLPDQKKDGGISTAKEPDRTPLNRFDLR